MNRSEAIETLLVMLSRARTHAYGVSEDLKNKYLGKSKRATMGYLLKAHQEDARALEIALEALGVQVGMAS